MKTDIKDDESGNTSITTNESNDRNARTMTATAGKRPIVKRSATSQVQSMSSFRARSEHALSSLEVLRGAAPIPPEPKAESASHSTASWHPKLACWVYPFEDTDESVEQFVEGQGWDAWDPLRKIWVDGPQFAVDLARYRRRIYDTRRLNPEKANGEPLELDWDEEDEKEEEQDTALMSCDREDNGVDSSKRYQ